MNEPAQNKLRYLEKMTLLSTLPKEASSRLERVSLMRSYHKGYLIFRPGEAACKIFIIKKGVVKLYRSEDGRRISILELKAGDVFGDFSFSAGESVPADYFAEALADSIVCVVPTSDFRELIRAYPEIALRLIGALSTRLKKTQTKIHDLALSKAETKVLRELKRRADENGVTPPLTHEAIAEATGLSRETVTRMIAKLKKKECFKVLPRHQYELC